MKNLYLFLLTLLFCAFSHAQELRSGGKLTSKKNTSSGKRLALLIGNANYNHKDNNLCISTNNCPPVNDATDLAKKLRELNFDVILKTNAALDSMDVAIEDFALKLEEEDYSTALFYYAGHATEIKIKNKGTSNYLFPIDAAPATKTAVQRETYNMSHLFDALDGAQVLSKIIIIDACRNNPFTRSWNRTTNEGGLAYIGSPEGTFLVYSTAPGQTAANQGSNNRNGLFTQHLLANIGHKDNSLIEVFQNTAIDIYKEARETGQFQIPFMTTSMASDLFLNQKLTPFKSSNLYGYQNRFGQTVIQAQYQWAGPFLHGKAAVKKGVEIYFINKLNNEIDHDLTKEFALDSIETKIIRVDAQHWALINKKSQPTLRFLKRNYRSASPFKDDFALVEYSEGRYGFVDKTGTPLFNIAERNYFVAHSFEGDFARVQDSEGRYGFVDKTGTPLFNIAERNYFVAHSFEGDFARVVDSERRDGFVDKTGTELFDIAKRNYSYASSFEGDFALVQDSERRDGFVDKTGTELFDIAKRNYIYVEDFKDDFARVQDSERRYGFVDKTGTPLFNIAERNYFVAHSFEGDFARVVDSERRQGFVDKTGTELFDIAERNYSYASSFEGDFARVWDSKVRYGFVDKTGTPLFNIAKRNYRHAASFEGDFARVVDSERRIGFVDKTGAELFDIAERNYRFGIYLKNGFAVVKDSEGRWGFVDKTGVEIVSPEYESIEYTKRTKLQDKSKLENFIYPAKKDGYWGVINAKGETLVPFNYTEIFTLDSKEEIWLVRPPNSLKKQYFNSQTQSMIGNQPFDNATYKEGVIYYQSGESIECYNENGEFLYFETLQTLIDLKQGINPFDANEKD